MFYVIEQGSVEVLVAGPNGGPSMSFGKLSVGRSFGELALMYDTPRNATVRATESVVAWQLDRDQYRGIVRHHQQQRINRYADFLKGVPILQRLKPKELNDMAAGLVEDKFAAGEVIIKQGETGETFYIVLEGTVDVIQNGEKVASLESGKFFGEKALLTDDVRDATVSASNEGACTCLTMGRAELWLIILPIWGLQIAWSKWWMDRFRFGPFEWLWRTATYWKAQPMRR